MATLYDINIRFKEGKGPLKGSKIVATILDRKLVDLAFSCGLSSIGGNPLTGFDFSVTFEDESKKDNFCGKLDALDYVDSYKVIEF